MLCGWSFLRLSCARRESKRRVDVAHRQHSKGEAIGAITVIAPHVQLEHSHQGRANRFGRGNKTQCLGACFLCGRLSGVCISRGALRMPSLSSFIGRPPRFQGAPGLLPTRVHPKRLAHRTRITVATSTTRRARLCASSVVRVFRGSRARTLNFVDPSLIATSACIYHGSCASEPERLSCTSKQARGRSHLHRIRFAIRVIPRAHLF